PRDRTSQVLSLVAGHYNEIAWTLKDAVPAFTRRIAGGLGFAEDPGTGESFGQHRCRLLAEALRSDAVRETRGSARRLAQLVTALEQKGVCASAPYLRVSKTAGDEDACTLGKLAGFKQRDRGPVASEIDLRSRAVAMAAMIGGIMSAEALWRGRG